jgi:putative endonuclease
MTRDTVGVLRLPARQREERNPLGVTNDLIRRVYEHKAKALPGFTARSGLERLVWFEVHDDVEAAILREKDIKKWRPAWKIRLIEESNPDWRDLYDSLAA